MKNGNELTIRQTESKRLENLRTSRTQMKKWSVARYPTPSKKFKSLSALRKAIDAFFEDKYKYSIQAMRASSMPTVTDLAIYLGYASQKDLYNEINNPVEPEYSKYLERAVDVIQDMLLKKQMDIAEVGKRWEGVDAALSRMERISNETKPKEDNNSINLQINLNAQEKTKARISESIDALFEDISTSNLRPANLLEEQEDENGL